MIGAAIVVVVAVLVAAGVSSGGHSKGQVAADASSASTASGKPVVTAPSTPAAPTTSAPPTTPAPTTKLLPGAAAVASLGTSLAQSAAVRPTVQNAINGVEACTVSASAGQSTIQQAIDTRQTVAAGVSDLDLSTVPNGAAMINDLTSALQKSIQADQDYQQWMSDVGSSGACGKDPRSDSNYQAGNSASQEASSEKAAFTTEWNAIAPQYGQPTYTSNQI